VGLSGNVLIKQVKKSPQGFQDFTSGSGDQQQRVLAGWRNMKK